MSRYTWDVEQRKFIPEEIYDAAHAMENKSAYILPDIKPHVTDDITGKPIEIRSRSQKREVMKRHSVVEFSPNSKAHNRNRFEGGPKVEWGKKYKRKYY